MSNTVRFTQLVSTCGKPRIYVPLIDPRKDTAFTRAAREKRILTLKQKPTGTQKDYGTVGVLAGKFVSYLLFPKSLASFEDKRVVGIKYDELERALPSPDAAPSPALRPKRPPKVKPAPEPKLFKATVRITATKVAQLRIKALSRKEAKARATETAQKETDFSGATLSVRIGPIRKWADSQ